MYIIFHSDGDKTRLKVVCASEGGSKAQTFLSDAQLDTQRKIPCKFQLNPSSRLGGVVVTRFFDFDDLQTYLRTDGKNFCQVHN